MTGSVSSGGVLALVRAEAQRPGRKLRGQDAEIQANREPASAIRRTGLPIIVALNITFTGKLIRAPQIAVPRLLAPRADSPRRL